MDSSLRLTAEQVLSRIAKLDVTAGELSTTALQIAELTAQALPGADEVSVTLVRGDHPTTLTSTGELAATLDERQYELGHGPCLDAAASGATLVIDDMATETRWPDYTPRAVEAGAGSSMSVSLPVPHDVSGALNIYSRRASVFDAEAQDQARWIANHVAAAVANAARYVDAVTLTRQLRTAMASRAVIEQAKGILMLLHRCDEATAFLHLSRVSQHNHRALRDVAADVVAGARTEFDATASTG